MAAPDDRVPCVVNGTSAPPTRSSDGEVRHFHAGEALLQAESGIDTDEFELAVAEAFRPELSDSEIRFVGARTFSVAATVDRSGRPWASPLIGAAGELFTVLDATTVRIGATSSADRAMVDDVRATGELGVLYFDPSRRRRAKSLGRGVVEADGSITYRMHRNFGLCTKYIFKRTHEVGSGIDPAAPATVSRSGLDGGDRRQLAGTDTIFLASHHVEHGADATHRGGPAGFVQVLDDTTVSLPDYVGNGMFQTFGNLVIDDRVGLLAVDFASGRTLQLTGRGTVERAAGGDPIERRLVIEIDEVRVMERPIGTWTDVEASPWVPELPAAVSDSGRRPT